MDEKSMTRLLRRQDGVVTRRQLSEVGVKDGDVERMIRRRELTRIGSALFLDHTGAPTWEQRAWAAVLAYAPAALADVERPHGLPTAERQRRVKPGKTAAYRDVDYVGLATGVELDGRLGHEEALDRWKDLDRDLDGVTAGQITLRAGWAQVLEPCRLAAIVGGVLTARGWSGELISCGPGCPVGDCTTEHASGM